MDFELKTLTRTRLCLEKTDALIVLVPEGMVVGDDPLSMLAALAIDSGDFEAKPGKLLSAYRPEGIAATRLILAGAGDGSQKSVRTAVNAAMATLKAGNAQRALLYFGAMDKPGPEAVRAAVVACSETA